jgi:hypothetical protein
MSDDVRPPEGGPDGADAPLEELADLTVPVDAAFADRVHRRIERRVLTTDLVELAWAAPLEALMALLRAPFEWFDRPKP